MGFETERQDECCLFLLRSEWFSRPNNLSVFRCANVLKQRRKTVVVGGLVAIEENGRSEFVADNDVRPTVTGEISNLQLRANTDAFRNEIRLKSNASIGPHCSEPIQDRKLLSTGIVSTVRVEPLSGDNVLHTVAIDICERNGVHLRNIQGGVGFKTVRKDYVRNKSDIVAFASSFEPFQSPSMSTLHGNDVAVAVSIEVVDEHLRSTGGREGKSVKAKQRTFRFSLFPPSVFLQQIRASVGINVPNSHSVRESAVPSVFRYWHKRPGLRRLISIDDRISVRSFGNADKFRVSVVGDVYKCW